MDVQLQPIGELGGTPGDAGEGLCWGYDVLGLTSPESWSGAGEANGNLSWCLGSLVYRVPIHQPPSCSLWLWGEGGGS